MQNSSLTTRQLSYLSPWLEDVSQARMQSLGITGGFSGAVVWRVSVADNNVYGKDLCLRRWPQAHPSLTGLLAIHGLLKHVDAAGFDLVPVPLATRFGESYSVHDDHLWELTPWLPGAASLSTHPSAEKLAAAMQTLARFHQAAHDYQFEGKGAQHADSPGLQQRLFILQGLQQGELQELWKATRSAPASDLRELAFELLESLGQSLDTVVTSLKRVVEVSLPLQWCLRDIRHDHVLLTGEDSSGHRVSGLLDFGAVAVDSVAVDIARLLGSLLNNHDEHWQFGVAAYCQQRQLSSDELRAIINFDQGGVLCSATNWVRWLFVEGKSFPQIHALHAQLIWLRDRLRILAQKSIASSAQPINGPAWGRTQPSSASSKNASGAPHRTDNSPWMHT